MPQSVRAELRYIADTGVKPRIHVSSRNAGRSTRREFEVDIRRMEIRDDRALAGEANLDREGFELRRHSSAVTDFHDDEEIERVHYAEIERLIRHATGAGTATVFDHIRRSSEDGRAGARVPVFAVHNDYTPKSAAEKVRDLFPGQGDDYLERRFALINAWHPVRGPVKSFPLAVCDGRSIRPDDLVAADLVYEADDGGAFTRAQSYERVGEVFYLAHSPDHRWFYFSGMEREETLLFKCHDSAVDGRARCTAHTAFVDPDTAPDAAPRESIELRALVSFGRGEGVESGPRD